MNDLAAIAELIRARVTPGVPYIVGIAGSVAVGKSTFAAALRDIVAAWPARVQSIATDGFLHPNAVLNARGLTMRKGFPESYDFDALRTALASVKAGKRTALPRYSHVAYDVDTENPLVVEKPDVLILDGLHLANAKPPIDCLIYLDAGEEVIARWFTDRLLPLMLAGRDDPASFYYRFRDFDDAGRADFAARVWAGINLPNLREHIVHDRAAADIVVRKGADHAIASVAQP
jgi:type I pantothenate kinase